MSLFLKFITIIILSSYSSAFSLEESYPKAIHILNEFDIDESYLYDDEFISFVTHKEKGLERFYNLSIKRGKDEILPTLKEIISTKEASSLLIYLSMVESGFIPTAKSNKKAVGLWQFIPKTARSFNLVVTSLYDERLDIDKSTSSAIEYLQYLHQRFGKWYIAIMAYNCGEGCMSRAIKEANGDDLSLLTSSNPKYLPKETIDYIKKILLLSMIGERDNIYETPTKDSKRDILSDLNITKEDKIEYNLIEVEIEKDANLSKIAQIIEIKEEELHKINPTPIEDKLQIPFDKIYLFYLKYELDRDARL